MEQAIGAKGGDWMEGGGEVREESSAAEPTLASVGREFGHRSLRLFISRTFSANN